MAKAMYKGIHKDGYYLDDQHGLVQIRGGIGTIFHPAQNRFAEENNHFFHDLSFPLTDAQAAKEKRSELAGYENMIRMAENTSTANA